MFTVAIRIFSSNHVMLGYRLWQEGSSTGNHVSDMVMTSEFTCINKPLVTIKLRQPRSIRVHSIILMFLVYE